jgi:hypothetical protein
LLNFLPFVKLPNSYLSHSSVFTMFLLTFFVSIVILFKDHTRIHFDDHLVQYILWKERWTQCNGLWGRLLQNINLAMMIFYMCIYLTPPHFPPVPSDIEVSGWYYSPYEKCHVMIYKYLIPLTVWYENIIHYKFVEEPEFAPSLVLIGFVLRNYLRWRVNVRFDCW